MNISFLKVLFLAMAEYSSELELCSFGLTKSFPYGLNRIS